MSKELLQLGWRSVGKRGLAFEPFCDPPHSHAVRLLASIGIKERAAIGQLRFAFDADGAMTPLDATRGIPQRLITRIATIGEQVINDGLRLLKDMETIEMEEVTSIALLMLAEHDRASAEALRNGEATFDTLVTVEFDRGSPLVAPRVYESGEPHYAYDDRRHTVCATFPVRNLPPAVVRWDGSRVHVTLPGVPLTNPLAGWTAPEEQHADMLKRVILRSLQSIVDMNNRRAFAAVAAATR